MRACHRLRWAGEVALVALVFAVALGDFWTAKAKIDSDEKVDIPGAKEAHRLTATVPPRAGTDPAEIKSASLDVLRDNGDTLTVVVAAPQRDGDDELDPEAVVGSLRLSGASG